MASQEQKLPIVVKVLIGLVVLLFSLPILAIAPALLRSINTGKSRVSNRLSEWEGQSSPDLAITTTDGTKLQLSEFRGRAVILDYWATWCGPCVREIPHLQKVADEFPQDLVVIGISSESMSVLQKFASSKSLRYQVGNAANSPSPYADITVLPTTFFIDRKGTIQKVLRGYHDYSQLNAQASMLIQ
jgi:peroxiredoxin